MNLRALSFCLLLLAASLQPCHANPMVRLSSTGVGSNGNRQWLVEVETDDAGAAASQLLFESTGGEILSAQTNTTDWDRNNPISLLTQLGDAQNPATRGVQLYSSFFAGSSSAAGSSEPTGSSSPLSILDGLAGDFNLDGIVDDADYTIWRDNVGLPEAIVAAAPDAALDFSLLPGDANADGIVDDTDYEVWLANYGFSAGVFSVASAAADAPTLFAALGSRVLGPGETVTLLTFETLGAGPTTVTWSGTVSQQGVVGPLFGGAVSVVPEPATSLLLITATGVLVRRKRRSV